MILHGTFNPESLRLVLWGESPDLVIRRGRAPKIAAHPFALTTDQLVRWIADRATLLQPNTEQTTIWLPSGAKLPQPSPELVAMGASTDDMTDVLTLRAWQVPCVTLAVSDAIGLLLAIREADSIGVDLRFWRVAGLEALALIAGQQIIPTFSRIDKSLEARWQIHPDMPETLYELSKQMPALCRAVTSMPDKALDPTDLLTGFLNAVVDSLARIPFETTPRLKPNTTAGKWLTALTGKSATVALPRNEADALYKDWEKWLGNSEIAGNHAFRIAFRLDTPADSKGQWALHYLLQALNDPSLIITADQLWHGEAVAYLRQRFDNPQERLLAGLGFSARLFKPIERSLQRSTPQLATLNNAESYQFLKEVAPLLQGSGFRVLLPRWWDGKGKPITARAKIKSPKATGKSLLSLDSLVHYDWQVTLAGQTITHEEFEQLAALKQPLVQWRGQWIALDDTQIKAGLAFFEQASGDLRLGDALRIGLDESDANTPIATSGWIKTLFETLQKPEKIESVAPPAALQAKLRPYQARGFSWLVFLRKFGLGACLADDMGLGKTLQAIALLVYERDVLKVKAHALLICPTSVIGNWRREIAKFAPNLTVHAHHGADRLTGDAFAQAAKKHNVILTSFPLLARDRALFESVTWSTLILDEAQNIKNPETKQAQAARAIHADNRVALTGTPVENRLSELWSILHFLNPGYLGTEKIFRNQFAIPIEQLADKDAAGRLKRLTAPFILRRLKTDPTIISDLPDKLEMKVYTPLTTEQATLYEAIVKDALEQITKAEQDGDTMSRRGLILSMLMRLKQICNHPAQFLKENMNGGQLAGRSGKLARLTEMLEEVYSVGDRALIFTQFAEMGELLRVHLRNTFTDEPLWLHGSTPIKERERQIARFQAPKGPTIFILSIKAGGVGLNLTQANHVFHFDRWWNPAVENQATDRAFRIGQTRNVQVHKFICSGTLEEKIDAMIESKRALAESIVGADESWLTELGTDALRDLVRLQHSEIEV